MENRANIHNKNNNGKEPRDVAVEKSIVFSCIVIHSAHVQNKIAFFFQDFPRLVKLLDTVDKYWNPWKGKHQVDIQLYLNLKHFFISEIACRIFSKLPDEYITGGKPAEREEFPWMVFFQKKILTPNLVYSIQVSIRAQNITKTLTFQSSFFLFIKGRFRL